MTAKQPAGLQVYLVESHVHITSPDNIVGCCWCCCCRCRFQPYRVAGGVSKRSGRGPAPMGRKWGHDLFDPNQPEGPVGDGDGEYGNGDGMME